MSSITSSMAASSLVTPAETAPATTRFLILSDTHNSAFPEPCGLPPVDVVLHCGGLTMIGGLSNYKAAIQHLSACDAELVLVIPGNHDVSLDPSWWQDNLDEDDDDPEEPKKAHALFADASRDGIHLLSEGVSTFTLRDGRSFSIYASPYTSEFNGYAFAYGKNEDRFNLDLDAENPAIIPDNVDIVMTHGPPGLSDDKYRLDTNATGIHCGCSKLWNAIRRARPRMHCFGHIHEGYGVQRIRWNGGNFNLEDEITRGREGALVLGRGKGETVLLNAAIMNHGRDHNNDPWVVDM